MDAIVLVPHPGSHPFEERTVLLNSEIRVGRTTSNQKLSNVNLLFDTKVLSRIHASIWVENGKCYIKDNSSTNGTFLNNRKLVATDPTLHELCQGDLVQFGTNVPGPNGSQYLPVIADVIFIQKEVVKSIQTTELSTSNQGSSKFHTGIIKLLDESGNLSDEFMREFKKIGRSINCKMAEMDDLNRYLNGILNEELCDYFTSQKSICRSKSLELQLALLKNETAICDPSLEILTTQREALESVLNSFYIFINDVHDTNLRIFMELENLMNFCSEVHSNLFEVMVIERFKNRMLTTKNKNLLEDPRQAPAIGKHPKIVMTEYVYQKLCTVFPRLYVDCFKQLFDESQSSSLTQESTSLYFNELIEKLCEECIQRETRRTLENCLKLKRRISGTEQEPSNPNRSFPQPRSNHQDKFFMPFLLLLGIFIGMYIQNYIKL